MTPDPEVAHTPPRKIALVTGGAARVGRAIALHLARRGLDVAITYRTSPPHAQQTVQEIRNLGRNALAIQADLTQPDAPELIHQQFTQSFDRLDALVNNAAQFTASPMGQIAPDAFEHQMRINALAPLLLIQKFAPLLAERYRPDDPTTSGRVVNLTDAHTHAQPAKQFTAYHAAKAALTQITLSCAVELAPKITVNAVAPGVVAWAESFSPEQRAQYLKRVPLARPGTPEDAASAVAFFVLEAHYCTGQVLRVDGGRSVT